MTEQSQMPLVGPLKRRGWREIVWFRPLTSSTHTALVVTRRGRLTSILPAGGPRTFSDYLAWPYDFREVDTRERLLMLEQRLESFDSAYEFCVALRLVYQVLRAERAALEFDDVQAELAHAVVQSLRLSGRSFGIEQDKTLEEHLQETLIHSDALIQRIQALGLVLRRADVTVTLDDQTRAHAEALRYSMRERALHFQVAVESLEPDRSFDVHVGGAYRVTDRRAQDGPSDSIESAIQMAITRTLRRVGITFAPSDYSNAAKAMAEMLRRDTLLQSELSVVQAQLLRPTVQIQPDHSMVHVPRPTPLSMPDPRSDPMLRRLRQGLPRVNRPPALLAASESEPSLPASPASERRALPPPEQPQVELPASQAAPLDQLPAADVASPTLPLADLPASNEEIEVGYTLWPLPEAQPAMRALPAPGEPDDDRDERAPWADLIASAERAPQDLPWPAPAASELAEPLPWDSLAAAGEPEIAAPVVEEAALPEPGESLPWDSLATTESSLEEPAVQWSEAQPANEQIESLPWDSLAAAGELEMAAPAAEEATWPAPVEPLPWDSLAASGELEMAAPAAEEATWPAPVEPLPWDSLAATEPALEEPEAQPAGDSAEPLSWGTTVPGAEEPVWAMPAASWPEAQPANEQIEPLPWDSLAAAGSSLDQTQWPDMQPAFLNEPAESLPWDTAATGETEPLLAGTPRADADAAPLTWSGLDSVFGSETPIAAPGAASDELADDLGFTLDWSEPERMAGADGLEKGLGFSLDWTQSQPERFSDNSSLSHDAPANDDIITAHWDDALIDPAMATLFSDMIVEERSAGAVTTEPQSATAFGSDLPDTDVQDAALADLHAQEQPGDAQPFSELGASPWYTPTSSVDDQLPFHTDADVSPIEPFGAAWQEAAEQAAPTAQLSTEAAAPTWDEEWTEAHLSSEHPVGGDATIQALAEAAEPAWADVLADPSAPAEQQTDVRPPQVTEEAQPAVPDELITRMIGMIQSYGPAWFKMWSLELKERPERLPVVLGEVTADQNLLTQAGDPHVQSALLRALAAYSAPAFVAGRLAAPASLPSPALVASSSEDEDAVPDWLSLRAKWNGNGGGR